MPNLEEYISKIQQQEDAEKAKWEDYVNKAKALNERNQVLGGFSRFADSISALNPRAPQTSYGESYATPKEAEMIQQGIAKMTEPPRTDIARIRLAAEMNKEALRSSAKSQKEAEQALGRELPEKAASSITEFDSAIEALNKVNNKFSELGDVSAGPISGTMAKISPFGFIKQKELIAEIDKTRQIVGKAMEGGVLRKEDEAKYKRILAEIADQPAVAKYKIASILEDMSRNRNLYLSNLNKANYNVSKYDMSSVPKITDPVNGSSEIRVIENATGREGTIPEDELNLPENKDKYTRL